MTINSLFIAAIVLLVVCVLLGMWQGFLRGSLSLIAIVVSAVVYPLLSPMIVGILEERTSMEETIEKTVQRELADAIAGLLGKDGDSYTLEESVLAPETFELEDGTIVPEGTVLPAGTVISSELAEEWLGKINEVTLSTAQESKLIEMLPIPEKLKNSLDEYNNKEIYKSLGVSGFQEYISSFVSKTCLNIVAYLIVFAIIFLALHATSLLFGIVDKIPILHGVNHAAGAILGFVKGIIFIELLMLLLIPFAAGDFGQHIVQQIDENQILSWLYHKNILIGFVTGIMSKTL